MKKEFTTPVIEKEQLEIEDIITSSFIPGENETPMN